MEVLIAVVLLGILSAALYGSYFGVVRARERTSEGMEARRELGATLDLIRREIAATMFDRSDSRLHFVVEDRDNFGAPSSVLELTTLTPPSLRIGKDSGIVMVRYRMSEKDKKKILTRQEHDLLLDSGTTPAYPQMERISAFLVECYDGSKWVRSWDTAINGILPRSVRVTVKFEEQGKPVEFSVLSTPRISGR